MTSADQRDHRWQQGYPRKLPDGTVVWTSPTGHTYTTYPGSRHLFPTLCQPTSFQNGELGPGDGQGMAVRPHSQRTMESMRLV